MQVKDYLPILKIECDTQGLKRCYITHRFNEKYYLHISATKNIVHYNSYAPEGKIYSYLKYRFPSGWSGWNP